MCNYCCPILFWMILAVASLSILIVGISTFHPHIQDKPLP